MYPTHGKQGRLKMNYSSCVTAGETAHPSSDYHSIVLWAGGFFWFDLGGLNMRHKPEVCKFYKTYGGPDTAINHSGCLAWRSFSVKIKTAI